MNIRDSSFVVFGVETCESMLHTFYALLLHYYYYYYYDYLIGNDTLMLLWSFLSAPSRCTLVSPIVDSRSCTGVGACCDRTTPACYFRFALSRTRASCH